MSSELLRVGVIGAGRIGKVHAGTLSSMVPGVRVAAVADAVPEAARQLADACGAEKAVRDHREILEDRTIGAVVICTSTDTHAALIEESADAGKHIFCEKPIALDLDKIDAALAAVERNRVVFMVGFNRRYDAGNAGLRETVRSGAIGVPEMCLISSRDPMPPPAGYVRLSGGMFLDMTIHDFDLSRFLVGDEPEEVFARANCLVDPAIGEQGDIDTAMVTITFKKGALCHIDNSRRAVYGYDQRAEVFGSKGMASTTNIHENNVIVARAEGYSRPPIQNFFMQRYIAAFQEEDRVFAECVREGKEPPAGGKDGRAAALMCYAANKSLAERRPVRIEEVDNHSSKSPF